MPQEAQNSLHFSKVILTATIAWLGCPRGVLECENILPNRKFCVWGVFSSALYLSFVCVCVCVKWRAETPQNRNNHNNRNNRN